jgi:hypothetical protein
MEIIRWKGYDFSDGDFELDVPFDQGRSQWMPVATTTQRRSANGELIGVTISDRSITAIARHTGGDPFLTWLQVLMSKLNPLDTEPGELVMTMDDGVTEWHCDAIVNIPSGYTDDRDVDLASVTWLTTDPLWHAETLTTETDALGPPTITNPTFLTDTTGWTKGTDPTNVSTTFSRDAAVYSDAAGAGKIVVNTNTAVGVTQLYVLNDTEYPATPGDQINIEAWVRSTSTGLYPNPVVRFYDVSDAVLATHYNPFIGSMTTGTWLQVRNNPPVIGATAPANTSYCKIGARIDLNAATTGTVYFDDFMFVSSPAGTVTPFTIEGHAPTHLTLKVTPEGDFPQEIIARTYSLTNNGDRMAENLPWMVSLGDNSATGTVGTDWALLLDGKVYPISITDYDTAAAYMWQVIERLAPGQTLEYTLLVSDETILPSTTFSGANEPVIDIGSQYASASGGAHTTTVTNTSGITGDTNRWDDGLIYVMTGVNAGLNRRISASTSTSITHAAFPNANLNGAQFVLLASHNSILSTADWVYAVRPTDRESDTKRGLWYLDQYANKKPGNYSYTAPGSWAPYRYWNNTDIVGQAPFYKDTTTGDYFAGLDADRRPEGGGDLDYQGYDGVALSMPFPMTQLKFTFALKNPNGMTTAILGTRQAAGAAELVHDYEVTVQATTLTTQSEQTVTLTTGSIFAYFGQVPAVGDVLAVDPGWDGDTGTATSATATTLTDSNKEWIADQYIGGTISITDGTASGQTRTITDNTTTAITVASWSGGTPDATSRYVIRNKPYVSTMRHVEEFRLTWDPTDLTASAVSAETDAYVLYRDILIDYAEGEPYQRVSINPTVTGRYIVLMDGESLVIDGETMRAWIADSTTDEEIRAVPPQAYAVYDVEADGTERLADQWLWLTPGAHTVTLANDESGVACTIDVTFREAIHG